MHVASHVECIVGKMADDVTVLSCHSYLACLVAFCEVSFLQVLVFICKTILNLFTVGLLCFVVCVFVGGQ